MIIEIFSGFLGAAPATAVAVFVLWKKGALSLGKTLLVDRVNFAARRFFDENSSKLFRLFDLLYLTVQQTAFATVAERIEAIVETDTELSKALEDVSRQNRIDLKQSKSEIYSNLALIVRELFDPEKAHQAIQSSTPADLEIATEIGERLELRVANLDYTIEDEF